MIKFNLTALNAIEFNKIQNTRGVLNHPPLKLKNFLRLTLIERKILKAYFCAEALPRVVYHKYKSGNQLDFYSTVADTHYAANVYVYFSFTFVSVRSLIHSGCGYAAKRLLIKENITK